MKNDKLKYGPACHFSSARTFTFAQRVKNLTSRGPLGLIMGNVKKSTSVTPIEIQLQEILDQSDKQIWTIQSLFRALKGKGYPFLIVFLSLPFCQPIQIPGFSTPFGILLIFIGLRMAFGRRIWWPQWILKKQVSPRLLKSVMQKSISFFRFLRPLLHARWSWLCTESFYHLHGGFVTIMGLFLSLPIPIPFSNLFAAWALLLVALGLIEEDGLFVCIGYVVGCIGIILLVILIVWLHAWAAS
jgi:hypothetical protein